MRSSTGDEIVAASEIGEQGTDYKPREENLPREKE